MTSSRYMLFGFILIIVLVISEIVTDVIFASKVQKDIAHIVQTHSVKIRLIHKMLGLTYSRVSTLNRMLLEKDPFEVEDLYLQFLAHANQYVGHRQALLKLLETQAERDFLEEMRQISIQGTPIIEQAVDLARSDNNEAAIQLVLRQILPIQSQMYQKTQQLIDYYQSKVAEQTSNTHQLSSKWLDYVIILGSGILFFILLIAYYVSHRTQKEQRDLVHEIEHRKKIETQLKRAHDTLEKRVDERTQQLQQRTYQLNQAQHIAHLGHWEWEIATGALLWSEEIFHIFGVSIDTFKPSYQAFVETIHPADREVVLLAIHDALSSEEEYQVSHRIILPDNSERYVRQKGVVRRDAKQIPINMLGTVQDISESKALHDRLVLFSSVFHNTGDGVMITNPENEIIEVNEAFVKLLGYEIEDVYQKNPNILSSNQHDNRFYEKMWLAINSENQWQGEIWNRRKNGQNIPLLMTINVVKDEHEHINNYVALFRDISDIKENEQQLWHIAHHDPLTKMPNRSLMYAHLQQAITQAKRDKNQVALLLIDLDGFKQVNDQYGHEAGDEVLKHVAKILGENIRESDTSARYAGDEFIIILKAIDNPRTATNLATTINTLVKQPIDCSNGQVHVGASIGISYYPQDAKESETLISKADIAMYHAKEHGKNCYSLFSEIDLS